MNCPACGNSRSIVASLPWPGFAHINHLPYVEAPIDLLFCEYCGLAGVEHEVEQSAPDQIYLDVSYALRERPVSYVYPANTTEPQTVTSYQADLLMGYLPQNGALLDIGCFDGRMLKSIQDKRPDLRLVGYDVNPLYADKFQHGLKYVSGDLSAIEGIFDMITMSHSLQYEINLPKLFKQFDRLLKNEGHIYAQTPDVAKKPSGLLFADLHHHFTAESLKNIFLVNGYSAENIQDICFSRDALVIAQKADVVQKLSPITSGEQIKQSVAVLKDMSESVEGLRQKGKWFTLGTTIEAAFIGYLLGDDLAGYLDEAPNAIGRTFNNFTVSHPEILERNSLTVLPYGKNNTNLLDKFKNKYHGSFELV